MFTAPGTTRPSASPSCTTPRCSGGAEASRVLPAGFGADTPAPCCETAQTAGHGPLAELHQLLWLEYRQDHPDGGVPLLTVRESIARHMHDLSIGGRLPSGHRPTRDL